MSHVEIMAELPHLTVSERALVFERLEQLVEEDSERGPTAEEKEALDQASAEWKRDRSPGRPWRDVLRDIHPESV